MTEPIAVFHMPPISREAFADDETFIKAVTSSSGHRDYSAPDDDIDITGLNKCDILIALYRAGEKMGMGFLAGDMTDSEIRSFIAVYQAKYNGQFPHVDYLGGKPLKVLLEGDTFNGRLYDRDHGVGAARRIVEGVRNATL